MKNTLLVLAALFSFTSFSPQAKTADKKEAVAEYYIVQIYLKHVDPDTGISFGGQWLDISEMTSNERDLPELISGADFYNLFLPARVVDDATKVATHYLHIRVVKISIFLDGSVCEEVIYIP